MFLTDINEVGFYTDFTGKIWAQMLVLKPNFTLHSLLRTI